MCISSLQIEIFSNLVIKNRKIFVKFQNFCRCFVQAKNRESKTLKTWDFEEQERKKEQRNSVIEEPQQKRKK